MLRNYFKVALRNLTNNKLYSFLNLGGLAVGISVCMLIMDYVAYDRIFYPGATLKILDNEDYFDRMSYMSGPVLKSADPGIESFLRVNGMTQSKVIENPAVPEKKSTEGTRTGC